MDQNQQNSQQNQQFQAKDKPVETIQTQSIPQKISAKNSKLEQMKSLNIQHSSKTLGILLVEPQIENHSNKELHYKFQQTIIPLQEVHHKVAILQTVANIEINLFYQNQFDFPISASFHFAISSEACFHGLEAQVGNKVIQGVIKEKKEAKQQYEEGIKQGKTMVYTEIDSELSDTIKFQLGNIEKGDKIIIRLKYIEALKLSTGQNKYELILPFTLSPRCPTWKGEKQAPQDNSSSNEWKFMDSVTSNAYKWTIDINASSFQNKFTEIKSPSHEIVTQFTDQQLQNQVHIEFKNKEVPNKDFVLQLSTNEAQTILVSGNKKDDEQTPYCAFISLNPRFNYPPEEEKKIAIAASKDYQDNQNPQRGEFIFLIDRSGSMQGERIQMAQSSLILFVKSLPKGSYFNIVSFGSKFRSMYPISVLCSDYTVNDVLSQIGEFQANMGGTEIFQPLSYIFESTPVIDGLPRNVFLLTDGNVTNTKQVIALIKSWNQSMNLYAMGVGSGASSELINGSAEAGNGCSEMVSDNKLIQEKVIQLLKKSLSRKFYNFSLEYNKNDIEIIVPDPNKISFLRENQPLQTFIFLKPGVVETQLSLKINGYQVIKQIVNVNDPNQVVSDSILHKLGYFKMVKKMIYNNKQEGDILDDIYYARQKDVDALQKEIIEICVKYQLLTEITAFVCEVKDMKDENKQQKTVNVNVPIIRSADYKEVSGFNTSNRNSNRNNNNNNNNYQSNIQENVAGLMHNSNRLLDYNVQYSKKASGCGGGVKKRNYDTSYDQLQYEIQNAVQGTDLLKKDKDAPKFDIQVLVNVLISQKSDGYWEYTDKGLQKLGISVKMYQFLWPAQLLGYPEVYFTIVVLLWIEKYFTSQKNNWELIHEKSKTWLKNKGFDFEVYKQYISQKIYP